MKQGNVQTMKRISAQYLLAVAFAITGFSAEPTARSLGKCPNGHSTLKNVPIIYGLPPFEGERAQQWNKGFENLEFVPGGCVVSFESPSNQVICTTCRFAHSISTTNSPNDGSWSRRSPDAESFPKPISSLVKSFPIPTKEQQKESVSYSQNLSDTLQVWSEGVSCRTSMPLNELKVQVNEWLKAQSIECDFSTREITSGLDGATRDILSWRTKRFWIHIDVHHEHSDKSSWISATFFK